MADKTTPEAFPMVENLPTTAQTTAAETATAETATGSQSSIEPDWDDIPVAGETVQADAESDQASAGEGGAAPDHAPPKLLSKDDFYRMFEMAFHAPNFVLAGRGPFPLESLPIKPEERQQARAASDAIYEIAAETPALRWLLQPDLPWLQRTIPIVMFLGGKVFAIRTEIRAKRAAPITPERAPETPPEDAPLRTGHDDLMDAAKADIEGDAS